PADEIARRLRRFPRCTGGSRRFSSDRLSRRGYFVRHLTLLRRARRKVLDPSLSAPSLRRFPREPAFVRIRLHKWAQRLRSFGVDRALLTLSGELLRRARRIPGGLRDFLAILPLVLAELLGEQS